jgi:hypothetical protein
VTVWISGGNGFVMARVCGRRVSQSGKIWSVEVGEEGEQEGQGGG